MYEPAGRVELALEISGNDGLSGGSPSNFPERRANVAFATASRDSHNPFASHFRTLG